MNKVFKRSFLLLFLASACFYTVHAQRDRNSGQRGNSVRADNAGQREQRGGSYSRPNNNSSRNNGSYNRPANANRPADASRPDNNSANGSRSNGYRVIDRNRNNGSGTILGRNNNAGSNYNRDRYRNPSNNSNFQSRRNNRPVVINRVRVNNYHRYPRVYNYDRRGGYSFVHYNYYAPRRYVYFGAPRYRVLPRTFISISFGGYPYWYDHGFFYSRYEDYYTPVFAPPGIRIRMLPVGYYPVYVGPQVYYYYEGVYYRNYQDHSDEYEVVDAPMGAVVTALPKGASVATVNGEQFYEFNGTYYKEGRNSKNEVEYTVVGKNGNINNTEEADVNTQQAPQIGDELTALPENSREVTINGEVLYLAPDGFYLEAETRDKVIIYKIVGKTENK